MSTKLYRLKSNPKTIVRKDAEFHRVVWSDSMRAGYDARWMMARWNPKNVKALSAAEVAEVKKFLKEHGFKD